MGASRRPEKTFCLSARQSQWVDAYKQALSGKDEKTVDAYLRSLGQALAWMAAVTGDDQAMPTPAAVRAYIDELIRKGASPTHLSRVKGVLNGFALWLISQGALAANPTEGIRLPPRVQRHRTSLTDDQRSILRALVERADDLRGAAMFSLAYWAGCRISDISYLLIENTQVGPEHGQVTVGQQDSKERTIPLHARACAPLAAYLERGGRQPGSRYVFTSQREKLPLPANEPDGWRLDTPGIRAWWSDLKASARTEEQGEIAAVTFHDLRHDFEQRAQATGWEQGEIDSYLGRRGRRNSSERTARQSREAGEDERIRALLLALPE